MVDLNLNSVSRTISYQQHVGTGGRPGRSPRERRQPTHLPNVAAGMQRPEARSVNDRIDPEATGVPMSAPDSCCYERIEFGASFTRQI